MKKLFLFLACFIINIENVRADEPLSAEEREEFYSDINEWAYEQYEAALVCQEPEMQNYEEDDA